MCISGNRNILFDSFLVFYALLNVVLLFEDPLLSENERIIINEKVINNIRFADDTVIIVSSAEELQQYRLKMNVKKTKYMIITKENDIQANKNLLGRQIERVQKY